MVDGNDKVMLAHGGGGQLSNDLIRKYILPNVGNDVLNQLGDSASLELESGSICFTTDSYVVKPLFFNGGDIGKLAVCGTMNDLAVAGARPVALSLALIIETGLELEILERILKSIGETARQNNISIVTGDTKTVEAGSADKIFITTAGIGVRVSGAVPGMDKIKSGDKIIVNGTLGDHGMTIISQRKGISFESKLKSDCAVLWPLIEQMLMKCGGGVRFMRDATRGGAAATLNEIACATGMNVEICEKALPINPTVRAAADMLGFDVLDIANEGKFIAVVSPGCAVECLRICKNHPLGKDAAIIGEVGEVSKRGLVELITRIGGRRVIQLPYGRELPRIC
ncbi:MAG TPA: hydrogenase expression/formation protein HypE [Sedimentisphaerales bacterium]|nr:hydrogenase expression/formation protein HypE [Sedimentisphaerales bacterium]